MEDLFKTLGDALRPEKKDGLFDLPKDHVCRDLQHLPPSHLYIPEGKGYRHTCPSCGKVTEIKPSHPSW